jgi:hypothetical protein
MEADESGLYELLDTHFEYFEYACVKWISFLGFNDWEVDYVFTDAETDARAFTAVHCRSNRIATIALCQGWDIDPTEESLSKCAFHEVLELLLSDVSLLVSDRRYDPETVDRERHRVIRIFENSVFIREWGDEHGIFNIQPNEKRGCRPGQEVSEIYSDSSVFGTWLRRLQSKSWGWINRISPF